MSVPADEAAPSRRPSEAEEDLRSAAILRLPRPVAVALLLAAAVRQRRRERRDTG